MCEKCEQAYQAFLDYESTPGRRGTWDERKEAWSEYQKVVRANHPEAPQKMIHTPGTWSFTLEHKGVDVKIERSRWDVYITLTDSKTGEEVVKYFASADSFYAQYDEIYFSTEEERKEFEEEERSGGA
jgi:hypothetical protein